MKRIHNCTLLAVLWLALTVAVGQAAVCDVDNDGDVDRKDINRIFDASDTPASGPDDPRDEDGDGAITEIDARRCLQQCTNPGCIASKPLEAVISGPSNPPCYGETVTLFSMGSHYPKDRPVSFKWTLTKPDDSAAELSDATAQTVTFVADVKGQYEAKLVISTGSSDIAPASFTVTVLGPTADAGNDRQDVKIGETIQLYGGRSTNCSNNRLTFSWELEKPDGSAAELSDATAVAPTFTADIHGQYKAILTVNDGIEGKPDTVIIKTNDGSLKCGDRIAGAISEPDEIDEFTFTGQQGDVVSMTLENTTHRAAADFEATIYQPSGKQSTHFETTYSFPHDFTLPETGTYIIRIINASKHLHSELRTYRIGMECILPTSPTEAELNCGDPYAGALEKYAEVNLLTFTGQKDDVVNLTLGSESSWGDNSRGPLVTVYQPSGRHLIRFYYQWYKYDKFDDNKNHHTITLPETGTYVIHIQTFDPQETGTYSLGLDCILPHGQTEAELDCGDLYDSTIEPLYETELYTFTGQKDDIVSLSLVDTPNHTYKLIGIDGFVSATVFQPSGEQLAVYNSNSQKAITLPETGTYIVVVKSTGQNYHGPCSYTIGMECILPTGPTEAELRYGDLYDGAIDYVGEADLLTFAGQQGDNVSMSIAKTSGWEGPGYQIYPHTIVYGPSGEKLPFWLRSFTTEKLTLPETGIYVIHINSIGLNRIGGYKFNLERIAPKTK